MRGLTAVDDVVQILFDYHGVLMFSKNVLNRLGLVDELLGPPAAGGPRQLGRVP